MDATVQPAGVNTSANWSGSIWQDCPVTAIRDGQTQGVLWEKTFYGGGPIPDGAEANWMDVVGWGSTGAAAIGLADNTEIGGGRKFGSDGDNEGAAVRQGLVPFKIILTGGDFWAEWRMLTSTITDAKHDIFCGLFEDIAVDATHPIAADGTLSDNNMVGFQRPETARTVAGTGGAFMSAVYRANGVAAVVVQTDAAPLVAATYTNLGLKFVPKRNIGPGLGYFYWYQDGVKVAQYQVTSTAGNPFPNDLNLGFVFAVLNATGTTPGTSTIKKVRIAQLLKAYP